MGRGDESLTLIDNYDEFHLSLLFDWSLYRPMCTHMNAGTILQTWVRQYWQEIQVGWQGRPLIANIPPRMSISSLQYQHGSVGFIVTNCDQTIERPSAHLFLQACRVQTALWTLARQHYTCRHCATSVDCRNEINKLWLSMNIYCDLEEKFYFRIHTSQLIERSVEQ